MKKVKLFEQFINEAKMPDKLIGNDEIVFLKTKEDSRGANYNLYYKGHDIDFGGHRFGSEKELKAFADNYILSNQWYNKLKYEDSKPLPESVVTEAKNTIGLAFKKEQEYLDFVEFIKDERGSIKKDFGWDSKTKSWEVIMDVKVLDSIYGEGTPSNKESGWYGALPGDFESVIIEQFVNETKVDKKYFDKVVKVLSKSKYPFTVMLVTKWNEIDIVIGYDAPDDISDDIDQRLTKAKLNWGGSSGISISGDSSNYSRREYDEIARINGGHRDY